MGRKVSLASLAGEKVEDVPGRSTPTLVRLRTSQVVATPLNPRRNFGTTEELTELGESMRVRQLQPVVAVSRASYLKLWPDHEDHVGSANYVLANGERRYRSALQVALEGLDVLIREEVADSRESFLDAVLSENIDRKNFDPIEEAFAVEAMVQECGSARAAAERFRRHESWVSQRRALLKLAPALQERVRSDDLPVRIARSIASLPHEDQVAAWEKTRAQQAEESQQRILGGRTRTRGGNRSASDVPGPRRGEESPGHQGSEANPGSTTVDTPVFTAVKTGGEEQAARQEGNAAPAVAPEIPWQSPEALAVLLRKHLTPQHLRTLVELLTSQGQPGR